MDNEPQNVVITNIKVPFFSLMIFMIKWVLAAIPALILATALVGGGIILNDQFHIVAQIKSFIPI
jgi:hypothetical protein